ncbi:MAG: AMP-binding protein [Betaproteobacteria bacterium]|nr:AMP-binding protein [Betaproteobacteria bacterium]
MNCELSYVHGASGVPLIGETIGVYFDRCAEWVLTQFATAKAGLILVNINPAYRRTELEYALNKVDCKALILSPSFRSSDYLAILRELAPELQDSAPGRLKDMVIRGGENIYPREVEEFLYRHPKIQDVQCVGVPDPKYGEELCACIVLRPGAQADAEEIRGYCRGEIAHYKIPRHVMFVDGFPMTVTGKIQKYLLRRQMTAALGLSEETTA